MSVALKYRAKTHEFAEERFTAILAECIFLHILLTVRKKPDLVSYWGYSIN